MHIERALNGFADWAPAHDWLSAAACEELAIGDTACLFYGAPAMAFALHAASYHGYRSARAALAAGVEEVIRRRLEQAHRRIDRRERPEFAEYDAISGLTGLGAYLRRHESESDLLREVLTYLVRLTEPIDELPGWWTPSPPGRTNTFPPGGHSNHGLAHGVTGPLALLSLAARDGTVVNGQLGAITRICSWLDTWQQEHALGRWWPETISRNDLEQGRPAQHRPLRPSWCYGTPGIARAQQLAAHALHDPIRKHIAEAAIVGCLNDPHQTGLITDRGLCHGTAGLYMTVAAISEDADLPIPDASSLLLHVPPTAVEGPGLLVGSAGYALALHALTTGGPSLTTWDTCLLLR